ncbi:Reticulocalbin-2 [Portunus trituberculatus]|uniref:Reticulocalbin-2 n=1 Tax=Portunus trituberculatus TaxID=210409 RepID=A0A5B7CKC0_PORTR|nr:Reticulocalbin-2 [Portunus trituberculatus]
MRSWGVTLVVVMVVVAGCVQGHTHHLHNPHKEREADGSRSPRDHAHYEDGEHHVEFDHEAILGSTKEAEEYDQLPPAEAKRRLEVLLLKMDRNNDKTIDRKELHSWILRSFRMLSEEESAERMDEVDEDEDGYVTWAEYISETYGINDPDDQKLLEKEDQAEEQRRQSQDFYIINRRNLKTLLIISVAFENSISEYEAKDIAEDEVDHLFGAADDDGDDLLSFLEVLEHHDVFVGSEATDYGDHLHNLDRFEDEL